MRTEAGTSAEKRFSRKFDIGLPRRGRERRVSEKASPPALEIIAQEHGGHCPARDAKELSQNGG
jgi:hypothetical protein